MKRLGIAASILALGLVGCGSDNGGNPGGPSTTTVFTVALSAANEIPVVTNSEATARGTAVITVHSDSNTIDFSVSMNSFPNGSSATLAHIHPGAGGVTGAPLVNTGLTAGTAIALPNGSGTFTFNGIAASADTIAQILANPQNFYFNVHTALNPPGAIRGQLR
jgi:hypothetical protein